MSDEFTDAALSVMFKAGPGYEAPWIGVKADTPQDFLQRVQALEQLGIVQAVTQTSAQLQGQYKLATELGAQPVDQPPAQQGWTAPVVQGPAHSGQIFAQVTQGMQQAGPSSPVQSTPAPQAQAVQAPGAHGESFVKQDRYGNTFVYNDPAAPMTVRGPAVKATRQKRAGGQYTMWLDPAHKACPLWKEQGNPKVPDNELMPDAWVN